MTYFEISGSSNTRLLYTSLSIDPGKPTITPAEWRNRSLGEFLIMSEEFKAVGYMPILSTIGVGGQV
jgi:hypothetical protein